MATTGGYTDTRLPDHGYGESEANAAFIVLAANHHAALVEALEGLMAGSKWRDAHTYEHDDMTIPAGWHTIRMPTEEALEKARLVLLRIRGETVDEARRRIQSCPDVPHD